MEKILKKYEILNKFSEKIEKNDEKIENLKNFDEKIDNNGEILDSEKTKKFKINNNLKIYLISLLVSFIVLMFGSNNSFLYGFNDCIDLNWFITMGQGLLDGKIPYRDLFEQKGPLLYFVFAFIALFNNPFIVIWIIEIICFSIFLFYSYKIANRFLNSMYSYIAIVILSVLIVTSRFFYMPGGAVEEYSLPILAYFLYCMFAYVVDKKQFTLARSLIIGLLVGIMLWIKFLLLLVPIVMLVVYFVYSIKRKEYAKLIYSLLMMILGVAIVSLPILLFYGINGALDDLFYVYLINNLTAYSNASSNFGIDDEIKTYSIVLMVISVLIIVAIILFGAIKYILTYKKQSIWLICILAVSAVIQAIIKLYLHYFMPILMFLIFGIVFILKPLQNKEIKHKKLWTTIFALSMIVVTILFGNHTHKIFIKDEEYPQVYFAEIIRSYNYENPTLFCYNMKDYGFYNALNISPTTYYYAQNNISIESLPAMYESFDNTVKNAETDFVVVFEPVYNEKIELFTNYEVIAQKDYRYYKSFYECHEYSCLLLKKI